MNHDLIFIKKNRLSVLGGFERLTETPPEYGISGKIGSIMTNNKVQPKPKPVVSARDVIRETLFWYGFLFCTIAITYLAMIVINDLWFNYLGYRMELQYFNLSEYYITEYWEYVYIGFLACIVPITYVWFSKMRYNFVKIGSAITSMVASCVVIYYSVTFASNTYNMFAIFPNSDIGICVTLGDVRQDIIDHLANKTTLGSCYNHHQYFELFHADIDVEKKTELIQELFEQSRKQGA
jgi:hypothetical protein